MARGQETRGAVGERIRQARTERGLTPEALAERIGVTTEALSRYALRIQATPDVVVSRSCWIVSSAGATIDCSSAYAVAASASSVKVTL